MYVDFKGVYNCIPEVSGAQRQHALSKAVVKHDRAWSPHGWVTGSCWALRADYGRVSPESKPCADSMSHKNPSNETTTEVPYVYTREKKKITDYARF